MKLYLAPMEGVVDHLMRDLLTQQGGFDLCVTEFVRVVKQLLPPRTFQRICPELHNQGTTSSGVPVRVQLLGQDPNCLAENAVRALELGSHGIDLNFGCPAKTVNKSRGGAVLLKDTDVLYRILHAVRKQVPAGNIVSAKMRLGFEDKSLAIENALALQDGGADLITVHARTKTEGYRPPAYWEWIAKIKEHVTIPIIANGEIWNREHAQQCQIQSGCEDLMLGRGALALPNLATVIKRDTAAMPWSELMQVLISYSGYEVYGDKGKYYPNRIKQWLRYLMLQYPSAKNLFQAIRSMHDSDEIVNTIRNFAAGQSHGENNLTLDKMTTITSTASL